MTPSQAHLSPSFDLDQGDDYVTVVVAGQTFALPIDCVQDVFVANGVTRVPLAPLEIAGLLNLRGRVLTALCLRQVLGYPDGPNGGRLMAVGLEHQGEAYGLLVDTVGEVVRLSREKLDPKPTHLDPRWTALSKGVHRLPESLLVLLDIDALLTVGVGQRAA